MTTRPPGAKTKLREYFLSRVGETIDSDSLREVAGISEWARRVRELRDEDGWDIVTDKHLASLKPGEYILRSDKPRPAFAREISKETRALVLTRNGFTCQMCGAGAGEPSPYDPSRKTRLHIGHIIDKSHGGTDDMTNLRAVCSDCNEGASNVSLATADVRQVLAQLRKTPRRDQLEVLKFLVLKFPVESGQMVEDFGVSGPEIT